MIPLREGTVWAMLSRNLLFVRSLGLRSAFDSNARANRLFRLDARAAEATGRQPPMAKPAKTANPAVAGCSVADSAGKPSASPKSNAAASPRRNRHQRPMGGRHSRIGFQANRGNSELNEVRSLDIENRINVLPADGPAVVVVHRGLPRPAWFRWRLPRSFSQRIEIVSYARCAGCRPDAIAGERLIQRRPRRRGSRNCAGDAGDCRVAGGDCGRNCDRVNSKLPVVCTEFVPTLPPWNG